MNGENGKMDLEEPLKFYEHFGLSFSTAGDQGLTECPFCNRNRFYVSKVAKDKADGKKTVPGMYVCQYCGSAGNQYSFITNLHAAAVSKTTDDDYARIAKLRKPLPPKIFKFHKLGISPITGEWLFPTFNQKGALCNLYKWAEPTESRPKSLVIAAPAPVQHGLINVHALRTNRPDRPIIVVEGHWDFLAMDHVLKVTKKDKEFDLVAVPGTHVFKDGWEQHFKDRDVILIYDNDHPKIKGNPPREVAGGRDGMDRVQRVLTSTDCLPNSIKRIDWPDGLPDGFDVRDLLSVGGKP